jgi:5-methylcytosine-specific restriction endonuclease McrA
MNILEALERNRLKELSDSLSLNEKPIRKFVIGGICKRNHEYEYPAKSLRYAVGHACFFCERNKSKNEVQAKQPVCVTCGIQIKSGQKVKCTITGKSQCMPCKEKALYRRCYRCSEVKSVDDFVKDPRKAGGITSLCFPCNRDRQTQKRREKGMRPNEDILAEKRYGRKYRDQLAAQFGLDTEKFYLSEIGECGHDYQGTGLTLRYCVNFKCVKCSALYHKDYSEKYVLKDKIRYQKWLKNPRLSPTVLDLVQKEARRYFWENRYWLDEEYRKRCRKKYKERYQKNIQKERNRVRAYKYAHPEKRDEWNKNRLERVDRQSDGSVSVRFVNDLINKSQKCPYCLAKMAEHEKTLDHIIPIAKGGLHSAINIIVCCRTCNFQKRDLSFPEWLGRLSSKGQASARKMYRQKYGTEPEQCFLPFTFK